MKKGKRRGIVEDSSPSFRGLFTQSEREWFRQITELGIGFTREKTISERSLYARWMRHLRTIDDDPPGLVRICLKCGGALVHVSQQALRDAKIILAIWLAVKDGWTDSTERDLQRIMVRKMHASQVKKLRSERATCCYCCEHSNDGEPHHSVMCLLRTSVAWQLDEVLEQGHCMALARLEGIDIEALIKRIRLAVVEGGIQ
jgi:hypothetical protein